MANDTKHRSTVLFLTALCVVSLYFCYLVVRPFFAAIFLAFMLAVVFHPIHVAIQGRVQRPSAAAFLSTVLVLLLIVVPAIGLAVIVGKETRALYGLMSEKSAEQGGWAVYFAQMADRILGWAGRYIDVSGFDLRATILGRLNELSRYLLSLGARAVGNFVSFIINAVAVFFTLFFLFREGAAMKEHVAGILPLTRPQARRLYAGITESIIANVYGCFAVGAAQGLLTTFAFWVLGLASPVLWGLVTALFSLVPIIGSGAVWVPAAAMLFVSGHWIKGVIMLAVGGAVIAQADNVVRPYVISERANLNTLLVFFSLLGGAQAFGVIGLFVGPVVLSFTIAVLQMLHEVKAEHEAVPDISAAAG